MSNETGGTELSPMSNETGGTGLSPMSPGERR